MTVSAPAKANPYRRRGEVLERALYDATLAELESAGYGGLTMEGIAARAQTGKAALYRRWAGKRELVLAAVQYALPPVPEPRAIFINSVWAPRLRIVESILQAGVRSGEIDPATLTPMTARIGPALIHQHVLFTGSPPDREQLTRIIDAMILTTGERRES